MRDTGAPTLPISNVPMAHLVALPVDAWDSEPTLTDVAPAPAAKTRCSCGGETITFRCDCDFGDACGVCDGTGTGHAVVTHYSVTMGIRGRGGVTFYRDACSDAEIETALYLADEECRPHLETLLRTCEDDEPQPHHLPAARSVDVLAPVAMPPVAPMDLMDVLTEMVRVAVAKAA